MVIRNTVVRNQIFVINSTFYNDLKITGTTKLQILFMLSNNMLHSVTIHNKFLNLQVWSVVFHSWLGFLMLLWANVMWMVPRQNSAMGVSSRALSIYASLLLLAAFCFSVDYQWPSHFGALSLHQFGLLTEFANVITPLLIKVSHVFTFKDTTYSSILYFYPHFRFY